MTMHAARKQAIKPEGGPVCFEDMVPIALWQTVFKLYEEGDESQLNDPDIGDDESAESAPERPLKRNFAIGHEPIQGAYVACIPVSGRGESLVPELASIVYGRTNEMGWIVRRPLEEVGEESEVPPAPWTPGTAPPKWKLRNTPPVVFKLDSPSADPTSFYVPHGSVWYIFWTYSQKSFERFRLQFERDMGAAIKEWDVPQYTVMPAGPPRDHESLNLLKRGSVRARYVDAFLFRGNERHYFDAFRKITRHEQDDSEKTRTPDKQVGSEKTCTAAILNATPKSFWALYFCEWLQWYSERAVQDDEHWPYLHRLRSVIAAARDMAPFPDLEKILGPDQGEWGEAVHWLRSYAYWCATLRDPEHEFSVDRPVFLQALIITVSHNAWRRAGEEIRALGGPAHPAEDHPILLTGNLPESVRMALVAHFDMYRLGMTHEDDDAALQAHWEQINRAMGWVQQHRIDLISTVSHTRMMCDIDTHLPRGETKRRIELADRYHYQCACLGHPFWEEADAELSGQTQWDAIGPYLVWLGEDADLLANLFNSFLDRYVSKYMTEKVLPRKSLEAMVRYLYRYDLHLSGKTIEHTLPQAKAVLRLSYDATRNRAVAQLFDGKKTSVLVELHLLTEVKKAAVNDSTLGAQTTPIQLKRMRRALKKGEIRHFKAVDEDLVIPNAEGLSKFALALAATGGALKAGAAWVSLYEKAKQAPTWRDIEFDAWGEAAEETFQATEPLANVIEAGARHALGSKAAAKGHWFVRGAHTLSHLSKVGTVIESGRNFAAGGATLLTFMAPESANTDLATYLDRGETVVVWLETTKGVVQLATAGVEAAAFLGLITTMAAVPVSTIVAVGLVAIATLNIIIYVETGGESPVDGFVKKVKAARNDQFILSEKKILLPTQQYWTSGRARQQLLATSRLARQFGSLNALARQHKAGFIGKA